MLQDDLDDDMGEILPPGMFKPEEIDADDLPLMPPPGATGPAGLVPKRVYAATTEEAPGPWPLPPSQTRKRPRGKLVAGPSQGGVHPTFKADAQGRWPCAPCGALHESRTGLYGHLRFCPAVDAWRCEWCQCGAKETHHKSIGPNGAKTLCSACSQRFRSGHNSLPQQNEAGQYVCDQCFRPFASISALGGASCVPPLGWPRIDPHPKMASRGLWNRHHTAKAEQDPRQRTHVHAHTRLDDYSTTHIR